MAAERRIVSLDDFREHNDEMIREVQEQHRELLIVDAGIFVARMLPIDTANRDLDAIAHDLAILKEMDRLAEAYADHVPDGISAVDVVAEQRRD